MARPKTAAEKYLHMRTEPYMARLARRIHAAYCGCGGAGSAEDQRFAKERLADVTNLIPVDEESSAEHKTDAEGGSDDR